MRFLILLFPVMVLAQPNFSISKWEYKRRLDRIFYLREILLDQGVRNLDERKFREDIIKNKNLAKLQELEALWEIKKNERKRSDAKDAKDLTLWEDKYLAQKYLKTLDINSLNTEEKKKEFFNAIKILLEKY